MLKQDDMKTNFEYYSLGIAREELKRIELYGDEFCKGVRRLRAGDLIAADQNDQNFQLLLVQCDLTRD